MSKMSKIDQIHLRAVILCMLKMSKMGKEHTVIMHKEQEVYSVSCIGVLPFIEGSLGDCTKWSGSC